MRKGSLKKFLPTRKLERRVSSANVIVENDSGELLVLKANYKPYWSLPGGIIDHSETPLQAAARELQEETGLEITENDLELHSVIDRISPSANTYLFVFILKHQLKDPDIKIQSSEIEDYDWVSKKEIIGKSEGRHYNAAPKNWASRTPAKYIEHTIKISE